MTWRQAAVKLVPGCGAGIDAPGCRSDGLPSWNELWEALFELVTGWVTKAERALSLISLSQSVVAKTIVTDFDLSVTGWCCRRGDWLVCVGVVLV